MIEGAWIDEVVIRAAGRDESARVAALWPSSPRASIPANPPTIRSDEEVRGHFAALLAGTARVVVAEHDDDGLVGVLVVRDRWIDDLHVAPGRTGRGLGSRLVALAKEQSPGALELWTFQWNHGARRFYERHGFVAVEMTDDENEERAPDVRYCFDPLAIRAAPPRSWQAS